MSKILPCLETLQLRRIQIDKKMIMLEGEKFCVWVDVSSIVITPEKFPIKCASHKGLTKLDYENSNSEIFPFDMRFLSQINTQESLYKQMKLIRSLLIKRTFSLTFKVLLAENIICLWKVWFEKFHQEID